MITSFVQIAHAMRQCVACIEEYTRHDPGSVNSAATGQALAQLQAAYPQGGAAPAAATTTKGGKGKAGKAAAAAAAASAAAPTPAAGSAETAPATPGAKGKKDKKDKPVRDPNQPKRPASAYLLYQNAVRPSLTGTSEELSYKDQMKRAAEMWKVLPADEKKVSPYPFRAMVDPWWLSCPVKVLTNCAGV